MDSKQYNLRPVWNALLEMYSAFDSFCASHGLVHYVAYGTLLGAVRHGGFIPWDDDFDVMMPRSDYERLMGMRDLLPENMKWVSIETNSSHNLLFAKIIETRELVVKKVQAESNLSLGQGLFIDIFPLDGLPSNPMSLFLWRIERAIRRRFCDALTLQAWFKSRSYDKFKYVGAANNENSRPERYRYLKSLLGTPVRMKFENIMVNTPCDANAILKVDFGNWQELPPLSMRLPTHQILS